MAKENKKMAEQAQSMDDQELKATIENETARLRKLHFTDQKSISSQIKLRRCPLQ